MTTATRSRIVYKVTCEDWLLGEADDREGAEAVMYAHANRNRREITDGYAITPVLRKEEE